MKFPKNTDGFIPINFRNAVLSNKEIKGIWTKTDDNFYFFSIDYGKAELLKCSINFLNFNDCNLRVSISVCATQKIKPNTEVDDVTFNMDSQKFFDDDDPIWKDNQMKMDWYFKRAENLIGCVNKFLFTEG